MNIHKQIIQDILVVTIEEREANLSKSDYFKMLILDEIASGVRKLIISFKEVEYLDSSFLGALVAILKKLIPLDGKLILIELDSNTQSLFELTRLNKIFVLKTDLETALQDY